MKFSALIRFLDTSWRRLASQFTTHYPNYLRRSQSPVLAAALIIIGYWTYKIFSQQPIALVVLTGICNVYMTWESHMNFVVLTGICDFDTTWELPITFVVLTGICDFDTIGNSYFEFQLLEAYLHSLNNTTLTLELIIPHELFVKRFVHDSCMKRFMSNSGLWHAPWSDAWSMWHSFEDSRNMRWLLEPQTKFSDKVTIVNRIHMNDMPDHFIKVNNEAEE